MILQPPRGAAFRFDPGALCLELLTTGGPGELARFETLHDPADLADWATRSRLRPLPEIEVTQLELATARLVRDAILAAAVARAHGEDPRPEDLEQVNAAAAALPLTPLFEPSVPGGRRWSRPSTGGQLLATVARDAIELFTGPYAHRIRECGAGNCRLIFVDTSRPGKRRWCSMERCGNRHKIRALRAREEKGERVMTPTGLTQDAGWEIGVSKTLPLPPAEVWSFLSGPEGLAVWLGPGATLRGEPGSTYETADGTVGEVRSYHPEDRIRLTWQPLGWSHDTTVQVALSPARGDAQKTVLRFHQERLASAEERERQRAHWRSVIGAVRASLADSP